MKALLLAAGCGARLRPITNRIPKCLVPIGGRPLLDYWLALLFGQGATEVLINTHYLAEQVERHVRSSPWSDRISLVYEPELLGTGGTLLKNRAFAGNEPLLVAHADNLTFFDLEAFRDSHRARGDQIALTMMTFVTDTPHSCGIVEVNGRGLVEAFHEKVDYPPGKLANAAIYIVNPEVIDFVAALGRTKVDFSTEVVPPFLGRIAVHMGCLYLRDIGTPESLAKAEKDIALLRRLLPAPTVP